MRLIDLRHLGRERVIGSWHVGDVLIDPGPESCTRELLRRLPEPPKAILLTHIHLDHAGATGALVERWPDVSVYVHERGARHLADPSRLVRSAARLHGADMNRLWGRIAPVPAENLRPLGGDMTILGTFRVADTPGHASHHVSYLHERSGWAFTGDVAGVRIPPAEYVLMPTPPPDIDVRAWKRSLTRLRSWQPTTLAPTHFGSFHDVDAHLTQAGERLDQWAGRARTMDEQAFLTAVESDVPVAAYAQAAPLEHHYLGLRRYLSRS